MRRINAILTALIMALFLLHGVLGAFQLFDMGTATMKWLSHSLLTLVIVHAVIGIKLTWDSVAVWRKTGEGYFRQNRLFWARRISGLAVMLLIGLHATAFSYDMDGAFRLKVFDDFRLATQLLFLLSLAVHIVTNVKPALIAFGVRKWKPRAADILFVLSVILALMAAAFIIYYIRWRAA